MRYQLAFHNQVKSDIKDAYDWYEDKQVGLGERFMFELFTCYAKLEIHPEYYSRSGKTLRKILLSHFPYVVAFEIKNDAVFVYAVFHTSRNPKEISKRIK